MDVVVDEIDPLDAFMAGIQDSATVQENLKNGSTTDANTKSNANAKNFISEEELFASNGSINTFGSMLGPEPIQEDDEEGPIKQPEIDVSQFAYGGETPVRLKETDEERELREKKELEEFMEALRQKRSEEANSSSNITIDPATSTEVPTNEEIVGAATSTSHTDLLDNSSKKKMSVGRIYQGDEEDAIFNDEDNPEENRSALEILQDAQKKKEIKIIDHSSVDYMEFRKRFYWPSLKIKNMPKTEVSNLRTELEIKVRGKQCPTPITEWRECGFSPRLMEVLRKFGYAAPFAVQRQALPAIMMGRDVIGIARTGSGKTLAFLLPMFRHILAQPPLSKTSDPSVGNTCESGPIGLIMAPARELTQQIYMEAKKLGRDLGLVTTAVYGGSSVSEQIASLKRGTDVVVCTPGRMIDILSMNSGRIMSLKRVTYVVLDEADRMFDMGFEPQIMKILLNIRPDRQVCLFSATFPKSVEGLARKLLHKPLEITVGQRSTASGDITQFAEVREESTKFMRLLQLLGEWSDKGNILLFVNTQQACDQLFQDLTRAGYLALSLHGGKDQLDRDYTIEDFKRKLRTLMVATSVAGRGLDVKDLVLVINYHCPNHIEDYVHRVGRTGRAGRKGTAYTFISSEEEAYSPDLVKALEAAKQIVPEELLAMSNAFKAKVKAGEARYHGSGFKGKGFTFDESEKTETQKLSDFQKRQYELEQGILVEDESEATSAEEKKKADMQLAKQLSNTGGNESTAAAVKKAHQIAQIVAKQFGKNQADVQYIPAGISANSSLSSGSGAGGHYMTELEVNEYPQQARWKITHKETSDAIDALTGAAVIVRGSFVPAGRKPNPGERKLHLVIEGSTSTAVRDAKKELQRILDETTLQVGLSLDKYGKYNI